MDTKDNLRAGLQPVNMVFLDGFSHAVLRNTSKRVFDVVASLALRVATLPVSLVTALAIWIEDGPRECFPSS